MHMENLLETVEQAPLEDCQSTEILTANLYKQIVPFMEKGVLTEQEEMDFCGGHVKFKRTIPKFV